VRVAGSGGDVFKVFRSGLRYKISSDEILASVQRNAEHQNTAVSTARLLGSSDLLRLCEKLRLNPLAEQVQI
jgi:hypothetical protein